MPQPSHEPRVRDLSSPLIALKVEVLWATSSSDVPVPLPNYVRTAKFKTCWSNCRLTQSWTSILSCRRCHLWTSLASMFRTGFWKEFILDAFRVKRGVSPTMSNVDGWRGGHCEFKTSYTSVYRTRGSFPTHLCTSPVGPPVPLSAPPDDFYCKDLYKRQWRLKCSASPTPFGTGGHKTIPVCSLDIKEVEDW